MGLLNAASIILSLPLDLTQGPCSARGGQFALSSEGLLLQEMARHMWFLTRW